MKHPCLNTAHRQRGATLVVALIFLVLLSLFAFNAFNSSSTNVRVVRNQQMRQEAISAAQSAIEAVISTTTFSITPANVAATPITVDIDNNGVVDYTVSMSPQPSCYRVQPIKNNQLNFAVPTDRECITSGLIRNSGIDTTDRFNLYPNTRLPRISLRQICQQGLGGHGRNTAQHWGGGRCLHTNDSRDLPQKQDPNRQLAAITFLNNRQ